MLLLSMASIAWWGPGMPLIHQGLTLIRSKRVGCMLIWPHCIRQKASARLALGLPGPDTRSLGLHSDKHLSALCLCADIKSGVHLSSLRIETNNHCRGQTCFAVKARLVARATEFYCCPVHMLPELCCWLWFQKHNDLGNWLTVPSIVCHYYRLLS